MQWTVIFTQNNQAHRAWLFHESPLFFGLAFLKTAQPGIAVAKPTL